MDEIRDAFRYQRFYKKLSLTELAATLGTSIMTLSRFENGKDVSGPALLSIIEWLRTS